MTTRDGFRAGWLDATYGMTNDYAAHGTDAYASGYRIAQEFRHSSHTTWTWQEAWTAVRDEIGIL